MDQLKSDAAVERAPTDHDRELWDRIVAAVVVLVPEGEVFDNGRSRTFDDGKALQLSMYPGEVSLTTPYWFEGDEAERIVERLRSIAAAIEDATGLIAYDPQAGAAFLESGANQAAETFDRVRGYMAEHLDVSAERPSSHSRWRFWRR